MVLASLSIFMELSLFPSQISLNWNKCTRHLHSEFEVVDEMQDSKDQNKWISARIHYAAVTEGSRAWGGGQINITDFPRTFKGPLY